MTGDEARKYFIDKGLDYSVLNPFTLDLLTHLIQGQLLRERVRDKDCILRTVKWHGLQPGKCAFLTIDGTYFDRREAISFNSEGWIGFAGWASTKNERPIIEGFIQWCDLLSNGEMATMGERTSETFKEENNVK